MKALGRNPSGQKLLALQQSRNFREGKFQNLNETVMLVEGVSYGKMMKEYYGKPKATTPPMPMPSVQTDLRKLPDGAPTFVWFGHSSYLLRIGGLNVLVDPVFSGNASPFSFFGKAFPGSDAYDVDDMPDIDILIITHDHYDHLDFPTILKLHPRIKLIITTLGVGSHLEYWGIPAEKIRELDWWQSIDQNAHWRITATPARHFSGRSLVRNKTLWSSFVLETDGRRIYLGGDSGYDDHFVNIGRHYGPFHAAILECGQYGKNWPYIHMFPEQTVQAAVDLRAAVLIPVHWGKFVLSVHEWNEPVKRAFVKAVEVGMAIATPRIGEALRIGDPVIPNKWWDT